MDPWISPSTFATYSLACEACCSIPLNFSFCSTLVMMRHAARRKPAVLPCVTDSKFRSSTESSEGCSPTLRRSSTIISIVAMERRRSATMLELSCKMYLSDDGQGSHDLFSKSVLSHTRQSSRSWSVPGAQVYMMTEDNW